MTDHTESDAALDEAVAQLPELVAAPTPPHGVPIVPVVVVRRRPGWQSIAILLCLACLCVLSVVVYVQASASAREVIRSRTDRRIDKCRDAYTARISDAQAVLFGAELKALLIPINGLLLLKDGKLEQFSDAAANAAIAEANDASVKFTAAIDDRNAWDVTQIVVPACPITPVGSLPKPSTTGG